MKEQSLNLPKSRARKSERVKLRSSNPARRAFCLAISIVAASISKLKIGNFLIGLMAF